MTNTGATPPGWYPDTNQPGNERWWDGSSWGNESRPIGGVAPVAPVPDAQPAPTSQPVSGPVAAPVHAAIPAQAVAHGYPQAGTAAPAEKKKSGKSTGVIVAIGAALVLLAGSCVAVGAVTLLGRDSDETADLIETDGGSDTGAADSEAGSIDDSGDAGSADGDNAGDSGSDESGSGNTDSGGDDSGDSGSGGDSAESGDGGESDSGSDGETGGGSGAPIDSFSSCDRPDSDTVIVDMVNETGELTSFLVTVGYFDADGNRVADEEGFISYVVPGRRVIQNLYLFEEVGVTCEVLDVSLILATSQEEAAGDVDACEIDGAPNEYGGFAGTITVTNSGSETFDYSISYAIVGPDGIRRFGTAIFIDGVRSGESAPGEVSSPVQFAEGFTCEIVGAYRS